MSDVAVGIDIGTSSVKTVAIDESGRVIAEASSAYPVRHPRPGWDEQPVADWWRAARRATRAVMAHTDLRDKGVAGIGLSGQMHGAVALGRDRKPLRPAIIWSDARTTREVRAIERLVSRHELIAITGNRASTSFTASKMLWMASNEPSVYRRAAAVVQPKDAIRLRLTGELAADVSDASATLLFDLQRRDWSDELCRRLGIDRSVLAPVLESPAPAGTLTRDAALASGLPEGTLVVAGGGDAACSALGVGMGPASRTSPLLITLGTAGQAFAVCDHPVIETEGRTHGLCYVGPGAWCQMGAILRAGAAIEWLAGATSTTPTRKTVGRLFAAAAAVRPAADDPIFLPYLVGERSPHFDPTIRAGFVGLAAHHRLGQMARAVLEGVAFALRDAADAMAAAGVTWDHLRVSGGGARSQAWVALLADAFNAPVEVADTTASSARGAALLGGVGAGWFGSIEEAAAVARTTVRVVEPQPDGVELCSARLVRFRSMFAPLARLGRSN